MSTMIVSKNSARLRGATRRAADKVPSARHERYADGVVEVLHVEFSDLDDPMVADVVRTAILHQLAAPAPGFEVILDSPISANWRLKAGPPPTTFRLACYAPTPFRLACYAYLPTPAHTERAARVSAALGALATPRLMSSLRGPRRSPTC